MYTLYKNPTQIDTLNLVRYLNSTQGNKALPTMIYERNYPPEITKLPAIKSMNDGKLYLGIDECILFYESYFSEENLGEKAKLFAMKNPQYRCSTKFCESNKKLI